jgi:hypothetical protein
MELSQNIKLESVDKEEVGTHKLYIVAISIYLRALISSLSI